MGLGKTYSADYLIDSNGNTGVSGQVLISTATGIDWADGSAITGGPFLPLAGGTITGNVRFNDTFKAEFGSSADLQINHDATDSLINNATGHLTIRNGANDKNIFLQADNGSGGNTSYLTLNGANTHAYFSNPGNVGIGTTSPTYKLDVSGDFRVKDGSSAIAFNEYSNGATIWLDGSNGDFAGGDYFNISAYGTTDLAFGYAAGTKITMKSDGKLGIGTTSPSYGLDVNHNAARIGSSSQTTTSLYLTATNTAGAPAVATEIIMQGYEGRAKGTFYTDSGVDGEWFNGVPYNGNHNYWQVGFNETGGQAEYQANSILTVRDNGNVGIGTTSPGQKLEVAGRVRISTDPTVELYNTSTNRGGVQWVNGSLMTKMFSGGSAGAGAGIIFETNTSEKVRITSSGNVGIGTTSPGSLLQVGGLDDGSNYDITLGWNAVDSEAVGTKRSAITFKTGQTSVNTEDIYKWDIAMLAAPATVTNEEFGSDLAFLRSTRGSTATDATTMILTRTGNVGIGTGVPAEKLNIYTATGRNFKVNQSTANVTILENDYELELRSGGGYDLKLNANGSSTYGNVTFRTDGSERMRVTSAGNVGIGTTTPIDELHVEGVIQSKKQLLPNTSGTAGWYKIGTMSGFVQGGATAVLEIAGHQGYNAANNQDYLIKLFIKTSNASSTGPNGQGFNSWYERTGGNNATIEFKWNNSATNDYDLYMFIPTHSLNSWYSVKKGTGTWEHAGTSATDPGANSSTVLKATGLFNILDANVGIGTTSPGAKLQIGSATYAPNANLANNLLQIKSPSGFAYLTIGNADSANSTSYIGGASGFIVLGSVTDAGATSEHIRITNTGNVGIGTASVPSEANLSLGAKTTTEGGHLVINKATSSTHATHIDNNTDTFRIMKGTDSASGSVQFILNHTNGNVGIGTTSPQRNLTIYESSGNAVLQLANNTSGVGASDGFLAYTDGVNVGLENKENGYLSLATNATEKMRITATGNVGIGTTAPTSKLQVSTATNVITPLLTLHNSTSTNGSTAGASIDFVASSNVAATGARIISTRVADGAHMDLRFHTQRDQFAMIIDTSGNVGIGVTTPTHKLHVNGNMRLTGALRDSNNAPGSAGQVLSSTGSATDWIPLPATPTIYTPKVYNLNNSTNINSQGQKLVPDFGTLEIEGNTTIQQVSGSDTDFQVTDENTGIYEVTYAVFYKNTGNQRTPLGTYLTLNGTAVNGSLMVNYVRSNVTGGGNWSSCTNTFYVNVTDASHPMALCVRRADSSTAPSGFSMVEPAGMAVKSTISFRRIS